MEFAQAKSIIKRKAESQWDELFNPRSMEFENFDTISINGTSYQVGKHAKRLIGQRLRIPAPYIDRCPSHLQAEQLNWWLRQQNQDTDLFCRFEDNTLRAMFTKRYTPMDNVEIIDQLDVTDSTQCVFRCDDGMMSLSIPDQDAKFSVAPNDEMVPGVCLANSEVGLKTFSISSFYLRILCSNGLLTVDKVSQAFRHTSTRGLESFYETLQTVSSQVLQNSEKFKIAVDAPAENPTALVESFGKQFLLTKLDVQLVLEHLEPPDTMWAVINAFTAAANDPSLPVEKSHTYQRVGGRILALTK